MHIILAYTGRYITLAVKSPSGESEDQEDHTQQHSQKSTDTANNKQPKF